MQLYLRKQLVIAGILYIGQILVGYGMGWSAPIIPKLQDPDQSPLNNVISTAAASWIGSLLYVGCIIGPHVTGIISNIVGRKPCLIIGGIITALSFIIIILTRNLAMVFAARILQGLGIGIINVGNLVYIGEVASTNIRGVLLTGTGIASTLGTLVIYSAGPYISYAGTGYLGLGFTIMYVVSIFVIPESPVFQIMIGKEDDARRTLTELGRASETDTVLAIKTDDKQKNNNIRWKEIFTVKSNRKALTITLVLGIFQQMSGVVAILFFATSIFSLAGSAVTAHIATIIIGATQLVSSCFTPFFVEWSGRKLLLLLSTAVCCMSLTLLGMYFYFYETDPSSVESIGWLPLVTLIIFFMFYDFGFGIIPATLTGEMFRSNIRGPGSALTITSAWLVGFGVTTAFGYVIGYGGHYTFWFFAASCACAFLFTVFCVPETKGKSLVEIQEMLEK